MAEGQRRVLVAVDASDNASKAFDWYCNNVKRENDFVYCVHCPEVHSLSVNHPGVATALLQQAAEELDALQKQYREKMQKAQIMGKFVTGNGRPGETIIRVAEEENVHIIVTGTRGQGTIRRTIMGSVSDYVVHHAKVPVLVCRQ